MYSIDKNVTMKWFKITSIDFLDKGQIAHFFKNCQSASDDNSDNSIVIKIATIKFDFFVFLALM